MSILKVLKFITNHPVNRDQKLASIIRFAKWQIASKLAPGAVVVDWINGSRFIVRSGETGLTGNLYTGLHEFEEMAYLLHVLQPDDLFVDIGANVGSYSILASAAIGANGVAFEPVPSTYKRLVENMRINNVEGRVACYNEGVGAEEGELSFTSKLDTTNHALAVGEVSTDSITVKIGTLDQRLFGLSPNVIKIDVEGFESNVISGADNSLKNVKLHSVIMELNGSGKRYGFDEKIILNKMLGYGFRTYSYDPFKRKLNDLEGKNLDCGNTIFIRDVDSVMEKLESARRLNVYGKFI